MFRACFARVSDSVQHDIVFCMCLSGGAFERAAGEWSRSAVSLARRIFSSVLVRVGGGWDVGVLWWWGEGG